MGRYRLVVSQVSDESGESPAWQRAGSRIRQCLDEFDTVEEANRQVDRVKQLSMPLATGMWRLKVIDQQGGAKPKEGGDARATCIEMRTIRRDMGLTLRDLGKAIGVSGATISRWERKQSTPNKERVAQIRAWIDEARQASHI